MEDTWDDLQRGGLRILRRGKAGGYTTDAVLLADFARAQPGQRAVDLGCGGGILPLLLIARVPALQVTGVEIDPELAAMARASVAENGLQDRVRIECGDVRQIRALLPQKSADLVISNPPYHEGQGEGTRHQTSLNDGELASAAAWLLNNAGRLCLCCPAERLLRVSDALRARRLEPKRLRLVSSLPGRAPYLCLIEARLGARPGLKWEPQLALLEAPGRPSQEYLAIYQEGAKG